MAKKVMLTAQQIEKMKTAYEMHGTPLQKLATDNGVSVPTAARYLRQAGVTIRSKGRRPGQKTTVMATPDVTEQSQSFPVSEPTPNSKVFSF